LMRYNYKSQSPARWSLKRFPAPNGEGYKLDATISVARVQPRTSKGITAFLNLLTHFELMALVVKPAHTGISMYLKM
jgi:hypothetical protein